MNDASPVSRLLVLAALLGAPLSCAEESNSAAAALVTPGAEPRLELRPTWRADSPVPLRATVTTRAMMGASLDGEDLPGQSSPAIATTLRLESMEDHLGYRFTIEGAELAGGGSDPDSVARIEADLSAQNPAGLEGSVRLSTFGEAFETRIEIPTGARSSVRQILSNLEPALSRFAVPVPREPVGVGATWKTSRPFLVQEMSLIEDAEYRLISFDGSRATVTIESTLRGTPQLFQFPDMPPGARCELVSAQGQGSGEIVVDPARMIPVTGRLEYDFDLKLRVLNDGETMAMDSTVDMSFDLGPTDGD